MSQSLSIDEVEALLNDMKKKLNIVNASVIKADAVNDRKHQDLLALHTHVMRQPSFSISELDEIVQELGQLREEE
ncbi:MULTISPECIES: DUF1128 family protein [Shouchella]|uniref:DUF1128 family protein n=2 Tax=Shouchella TaxID=2893057 RepID=A0ABY7W5V0_9BACI|nr:MULTISPECIES: DUF1128 family protein [Shouchella]MED4127329.1 DUF1128 family protein [Shouchella miscanthi]WDF03804.1 DUF1128 family protein [Shouchella hunanensis]GAF23325.1 hypothetical protein JCM19047_3141 [Bacillus sp. JCM 19047]